MDSIENMTDFESLGCHLCNPAGVESCDESSGLCLCKPWYEGTYCENCRFSRDYVMAPNGSCIPCNCGLRSIYECFQRDLCMKYAGESVKEAVTISALFLSAIAAITCLSVCIVWRIITRGKRARAVGDVEEELDRPNMARGSTVDLASQLSIADDEELEENMSSDRRHLLLTPSDDFDNVSLTSVPFNSIHPEQRTPAFDTVQVRPLVPSAFERVGNTRAGMDASADGQSNAGGLSNANTCAKYIFPYVRREEADDERVDETNVN